ncbi:MAG: hypothetical protein VX830_13825 [Candidatus Poribacteria bacterium]|nr:hypothetical protein [Candidatus Poribacteria bacterium]
MSLESGYCGLKVRRTGFTRAITDSSNGLERPGMRSGILMLLPIEGHKVEGIGPGPLEEGIGDREEEPARTSNGAAITNSLRHDFNALLKQLKGLNGVNMRT